MSDFNNFSRSTVFSRPEPEPDLLARLAQAEETIQAIHHGEVDAVVVNGPRGPQVYTLEGADHPYRVLVEKMHEGTVTLNDHGLTLYSNPQFASLVGAEPHAVTGSQFTCFLQESDANMFASLMEAAIGRGHSSGNLNLREQRGSLIPVRVSLTLLDIAGIKNISILVSDLREQQRNEAILREEKLSRLILDQAGECIVVIDPQGTIVRRSESAKALVGGFMLLERFDDVFPLTSAGEPFNANRILTAAAAGKPIRGLDVTMPHADRRTSALLVSARPLWSEASELLGCVVVLTDITERKRAEEALAQQAAELARSNSDLRQFAYSASHDLREPLRQLAVFSELIQQRVGDRLGEEGTHLVGYAVNSAHRMEKLLADLLAYIQAADAPQDAAASTDANEVMKKIVGTFQERIAETGARIQCGPLPVLAVHEVHLVQLLQNLIGNALKYKSDQPPLIHVEAERAAGEMWRLSVSDNGIGIKPDYQALIFGLFQRLHGGGKYSGSGIGLAICQKIVHRYGGTISVKSELGRGSTFLFTLPGASA